MATKFPGFLIDQNAESAVDVRALSQGAPGFGRVVTVPKSRAVAVPGQSKQVPGGFQVAAPSPKRPLVKQVAKIGLEALTIFDELVEVGLVQVIDPDVVGPFGPKKDMQTQRG